MAHTMKVPTHRAALAPKDSALKSYQETVSSSVTIACHIGSLEQRLAYSMHSKFLLLLIIINMRIKNFEKLENFDKLVRQWL